MRDVIMNRNHRRIQAPWTGDVHDVGRDIISVFFGSLHLGDERSPRDIGMVFQPLVEFVLGTIGPHRFGLTIAANGSDTLAILVKLLVLGNSPALAVTEVTAPRAPWSRSPRSQAAVGTDCHEESIRESGQSVRFQGIA